MLELLRRLFGAKPQPDAGLEPRIQKLLSVLHQPGLEPTAAELADTLWLAAHITPIPYRPEVSAQQSEKPTDETETPAQKIAQDDRPTSPPLRGAARPRYKSRRAALYPRTGGLGGGIAGRPFRSPAVLMLPDALALGRALRPLHRSVPSRTRQVLDEEATVDRIAEHRVAKRSFWQPVLMRAPERWFELALVIDLGASMLIWQPLLADLRRLLTYNGAFRAVRIWYLETDSDSVRLRAGTDPQNTRACKPEELLSPDGRRLILVVSDCIARAWHTGSVNRLLQHWSALSPLAVLHMLPQRMWPGTALQRGVETRFFAAAPGLPNVRLLLDSADLYATDDSESGSPALVDNALKLPVVSLESNALLG